MTAPDQPTLDEVSESDVAAGVRPDYADAFVAGMSRTTMWLGEAGPQGIDPLTGWARLMTEVAMLPVDEQRDVLAVFRDILAERSSAARSRMELLDGIMRGLDREMVVHLEEVPGSPVTGVARELTERLRAHHSVQDHPLERKGFEAACETAAAQAGIVVEAPASGTHAKWDLRVGTSPVEHWALKTEGAHSINGGNVTVSKLTEARWIQLADGDPGVLADGLRDYAADYMGSVQRLLTLRHFESQTGVRVYQLVEIPTSLLSPLVEMDRDALVGVLERAATVRVPLPVPVGSEGEALVGAEMVPLFPDDGLRVEPVVASFAVRLDKSDGKVSLSGIPLSACVVHGVWTLLPLG